MSHQREPDHRRDQELALAVTEAADVLKKAMQAASDAGLAVGVSFRLDADAKWRALVDVTRMTRLA